MAANHDRGALEDLEAMLDRSLKITASPPRWQHQGYHSVNQQLDPNATSPSRPLPVSPVQQHHYHNNLPPQSQQHSGFHQQSAQQQQQFGGVSPTRVFPKRVPVPNSASSQQQQSQPQVVPQAVYQLPQQQRAETRAVPTSHAALGIRNSSSQHSISSQTSDHWDQRQQQAATLEAQRQQQILKQQQAEQHRLEHQRRDRLLKLQMQQEQQERELAVLRQRAAQHRQREREREPEAHYANTSGQYHPQLNHSPHAQGSGSAEQQVALHEEAQHQLQQQIQHEQRLQRQTEAAIAQAEAARSEEAMLRREALAQQQQHQAQLQAQQAQQEFIRQQQEEREKQIQREALEREEQASRLEAARRHKQQLEAERARESRLEREGAATMVQRTQDSQGNIMTKVVKKGVEDFDFREELGAGSYSTVVAAQDKQTLRQYAIKVLDKAHIIKEQKVKYVEIEKHTLNRLGDHPGIIRLYFTFQDRQSLYFVLDYAPNGELLHLIKRIGSLNEDCTRYYACQLLDAIDFMHSKGVIHRDLKPENILLDYKMRIKITDFGTAKLLDADPKTGAYPADARANSFVGTAEYVSPELLVGKSQGKSADLWAWGCVVYQMIAAVPPFQGNTQYLTFQKIARLQYSIPPGFPFVVRDLLRRVLVKAPQRWTSDQIKQHEFFENQDWSRKALWSSPPPRLLPYKPSVASMKPRTLGSSGAAPGGGAAAGGRQPMKVFKPAPARAPPSSAAAAASGSSSSASNNHSYSHNSNSAAASQAGPKRVAAPPRPTQQQQVFVPTASGLQPLHPSTLYGMPVTISKSNDQLATQKHTAASASRQVKKPTQSANAASAALYKTSMSHTTSYQQSQERISALKRTIQEQRQSNRNSSSSAVSTGAAVGAGASVSRPNTPGSSGAAYSADPSKILPSLDTQSAASGPSSASSPASPATPHLPQPPLTQVESQYSHILVSAQERILKMGRMSLLVSTHIPPQAQISPPKNATSKHSRGNGSVDTTGGIDGEEAGAAADTSGSYGDDSLFSKLFIAKNKARLVIITTCGRLLIMADERKILHEVPLGVPQIEVSEIPFQGSQGLTTKIVIQTHNKVFTLDDPGNISDWMTSIELSRRYYFQLTLDQERNAFNAAAAAASAVAGRRR